MNGFELHSQSYKKYLKEHPNEPEDVRAPMLRKIKALDFLSGCTEAERLELFNSSAFNDVVKGYLKLAVDNIKLDMDDEDKAELRQSLLNEFRYLFDTVTADQAQAYYYNH